MNIILIFIFFILGTIIGSFLNVVINRYNTGCSINGRSFCPNCSEKILWHDLIPIFSWFFLKGKCRKCSSKISFQYPLVEFFTGLIFVCLYLNFEIILFFNPKIFLIFYIWSAIIFTILIIVFVYDLKHKIIPNFFSYTFSVLSFLQTLVLVPALNQWGTNIFFLDLFSGFIFFIPFYLLWKISDGRWIGLGDGKLILGIGWFLGFISAFNAIVLAFWIGAIFSILLLIINKFKKNLGKITMKTQIPFGPFLIIATLLEFFIRFDFLNLRFFFFN